MLVLQKSFSTSLQYLVYLERVQLIKMENSRPKPKLNKFWQLPDDEEVDKLGPGRHVVEVVVVIEDATKPSVWDRVGDAEQLQEAAAADIPTSLQLRDLKPTASLHSSASTPRVEVLPNGDTLETATIAEDEGPEDEGPGDEGPKEEEESLCRAGAET